MAKIAVLAVQHIRAGQETEQRHGVGRGDHCRRFVVEAITWAEERRSFGPESMHVGGGVQAIVSDFVEAGRQHMLKEAADEEIRRERGGVVVVGPEGHAVSVIADQSGV